MPENLKITGKAIYDELVSRGIEVVVIDSSCGLVKYRLDNKWHYLLGCITDTSSPAGKLISDRKNLSTVVAQSLDLQLPETLIYTDHASASDFLKRHGTIVVKPNDAAHGNGVTVDITHMSDLSDAVQNAEGFSRDKKILLQHQIEGADVRLLMMWGQLAAASVRVPATIVGDGVRTVRQTIVHENATNPLRGENYRTSLNNIDISAAERYLGSRMDIEILDKDARLRVMGTANIGTGGNAIDVTEQIPQEIIAQAASISSELGLDCCGVDFIAGDLSNPGSYYFIEINASPSFGLHMKPASGIPRAVHKMFVDKLLTPND